MKGRGLRFRDSGGSQCAFQIPNLLKNCFPTCVDSSAPRAAGASLFNCFAAPPDAIGRIPCPLTSTRCGANGIDAKRVKNSSLKAGRALSAPYARIARGSGRRNPPRFSPDPSPRLCQSPAFAICRGRCLGVTIVGGKTARRPHEGRLRPFRPIRPGIYAGFSRHRAACGCAPAAAGAAAGAQPRINGHPCTRHKCRA